MSPPSGDTPDESANDTPSGPPEPTGPPVYGEPLGSSAPPPPPPAPDYGYGYGSPSPYSAIDAVKYGFEKFKVNAGPWILSLVIFIGFSVAFGLVTAPLSAESTSTDSLDSVVAVLFSPIEIVLNIILTAVGYIFSALLIRGALDETEGTRFAISSAFSRLEIVPIILLGLLLSIGSTIGLLLCFLPGIIFSFVTMFSMLFLVDRQLGPIESIKASFALIKSKLGESILTVLVLTGITILGILACCVGLIVAVPVGQIAIAYAYKKLQGQPVV